MAKLAINGAKPLIQKEFPCWPVWDDDDLKEVQQVIKSGEWGIGGKKIDKFAEVFSKYHHTRFAVPVANGSVAIDLVLESLDIGEGDEVIVPDITFMATAAAPIRRGAETVLIDIDPDTFCMNPELLEDLITDNTKAVIPVHLGGHPCDMESIMTIADKYGLHVIEDCSHAHGALWSKKYVGTYGDCGTFSLQASKTLNCGEGGVIVTDNEKLFDMCNSIANAGRAAGPLDYHHYRCGTNYRLTNIQAALLLSQMKKFDEQCKKRDQNGKLLTDLLNQIDGVKPQMRAPKLGRHGYYLFIFVIEAGIPKEKFKKALQAEGVPVQLEYPGIHELEFIRKKKTVTGTFPVAEHVYRNSVWLFHHPLLADTDSVHKIADAIKKVIDNKDELDLI